MMMKDLTNDKKLRIALTLMQVMCVIALLVGTGFALTIGSMGVYLIIFSTDAMGTLQPDLHAICMGVCLLLTVGAVSVCSYIAIFRFFGMTRRLKKERAFTEQNGRALRTISKMCLASCAALAVGYNLFFLLLILGSSAFRFTPEVLEPMWMIYWFPGMTIYILAFMYLGVGLVSRTLHSLLLRAQALQDENDLTV